MNEEELKNKSYSDIKENFKEEFNNTSDEFKNEYFKSLELDLRFNEDYIDNLNFMKNSAEENAAESYWERKGNLDEKIEDIKDFYKNETDEFINKKVEEATEIEMSSVFNNVREIENEIEFEKEYGSKLENEIKEFKEDFKDVLVLENKIESDETLTKAGELFEKRDELKELLENTKEGKFFIEQELDSVLEKINNLTTAELKEHNDSLKITDEMRDVQSGIQDRSENMGKGSSADINEGNNFFDKIAVIENPNTSAETLDKLANDIDPLVRKNVAGAENTSAETLDRLADDKSYGVREEVARSENTSPETLDKLSEDKVDSIKEFVAENSNTSEQTLDKLSKSDNEEIRISVATNSNASPETLESLASDNSVEVREAVLDNSNSSERAKDIAEKINEISSTNEISSSIKTEDINTEKSSSSFKM